MNSTKFIEKVFAKHTEWELGNRPRLKMVAEYCVQNWTGDIIEIGLGHGNTTKIFAEIAHAHGRRVIAVDPFDIFDTGWGNDYFEVFLNNTKPWYDIIDLIKASSLDPETIRAIGKQELCFAYVDGLHTYDACLSDIKAVGHCRGILAVDDLHGNYNYSPALLRAFLEGAVVLDRVPIENGLAREGYLIPGDK